jgi:4-diphosphocytidyl-2-C-methyl-D-erythritol kinase
VRVRAHAKINLTLRVLGCRTDGYHELRTMFQSLALHDTLTCTRVRGAFEIVCDEPGCPTDRTNLVWSAAERLWRALGRRGRMSGVRVAIDKRIPMQAGLGGGSSDAAAALRALAVLWRARVDADTLTGLARSLGADVAYFLEGGTALGVDRGDVMFPLLDQPPAFVVLVLPDFGVSTRDAYGWWDREHATRAPKPRTASPGRASEWVNDLERPVVARHPEIGRLVTALRRAGARHAAMSGSGSAVFGLFDDEKAASTAADALKRARTTVIVTRTLDRAGYARGAAAR